MENKHGFLVINGQTIGLQSSPARINDYEVSKGSVWSSDKVNTELEDVRNELDVIVEEANKNTTISDGTTSLTTTWSSKKTSDEIAKKAAIDDTQTIETSVWSSKKTSDEITKKQENIFKKHFVTRRNSSTDTKKYCLLASMSVGNSSLFNDTLVIEGVMGRHTTNRKTLYHINFDFKSGTSVTNIIQGYVNDKIAFNYTDIFVTLDEDNRVYIYAEMIDPYCGIYGDISVPVVHTEFFGLEVYDTYKYENSTLTVYNTDTIIGTEIARMSTSTGVKVIAGLDDTASSTTSTYSSAKIDEKIATYILSTRDGQQKWLVLDLGNADQFHPITVSDHYGGKIEIIGMSIEYASHSSYKPVKVIRYSYGDWSLDSATNYTFTADGDYRYKIRGVYYNPNDNKYYVEIMPHVGIRVSGAVVTAPTMVDYSSTDASEMTLIPESNWGAINDASTGDANSTWSSSKIASTIDNKFLVGTSAPTTDTCPVGCFYGVYEE